MLLVSGHNGLGVDEQAALQAVVGVALPQPCSALVSDHMAWVQEKEELPR